MYAGYQGSRGPTGRSLMGSNSGIGDMIPKGHSLGQLQQFTPDQMNLFRSLFSNVGPDSFLSRLSQGDQGTFDQMEAPALRQFSGLQGNIASRFSGMGSGARRSSGFQNTMNAAGSNFAQELQSQRQGLQRQALQDLMGMSQSLLGQRPTDRFLTQNPQRQNSFLQQLLLGLGGGASQGLGSGIGNLLGGLF